MDFCPNCGIVLVKKGKCFVCSKCGFSKDNTEVKIELSEKIEQKQSMIGLTQEVLPKTKVICPKCGNNEAYFWSTQTRSADEAETVFFRCVKCQHTWRQYR